MLQVVQPARGGQPAVVDAPLPRMSSTSILVDTRATLISAGTERAVTQLAKASLFAKAKARPDLVRQVITKARTGGLQSTLRAVRTRLADDLTLGYSGAGVVMEVGADVSGFRVGQGVATGGDGFASHAEVQAVPWVLASVIPDGVNFEQASFATVAAVGLHGLRQADVRLGTRVLVVGLGLIGQLTARMALAAGCDVTATDIKPTLVELAKAQGVHALTESGLETTHAILDWSRGSGADAVIITAGATGDSSIIKAAPARCRDRATVVAVGNIGLDLVRNDFYLKEIDLRLARSYGPGRYDRTYEEWGVDYPIGHVRWTEGRNQEAVLDLLGSGRLVVDDLISHRFPIENAGDAYATLTSPSERPLGIVLEYLQTEAVGQSAPTARPAREERRLRDSPRVGLLGSGAFARGVILPALPKAGFGPVVNVASSSGISAARLAQSANIPVVSSAAEELIGDPNVDVVAIATRHSSHADLVVKALSRGKHVYCEKPLALTWEEFAEVEAAIDANPDQSLYVGFNRRYSPMIGKAREVLARASGPTHIHYRVSAGPITDSHWYADRREGGRLLGEVCHFVDTCSALVGDEPVIRSMASTPGLDHHDSYHVLIEYGEGSTASLLYSADSHPRVAKELIEVHCGGHTIVIDNFRRMKIDGAKAAIDGGKGHVDGLVAWLDGAAFATTALSTTRTMLVLKDSLSEISPNSG